MNRQLKTILLLLTFALCANAQQALDSIKIKPTWCVPTASHTRT